MSFVKSARHTLHPLRRRFTEFRERHFPARYPDMDDSFDRVRHRFTKFTMTSVERQYALWKSVEYIESAGIEGEFVECGVWRGGSSMVAATALRRAGSASRDLWLYDTFEGMSAPGEFDVAPDGSRMDQEWQKHEGRHHDPVFAFGSLEEVRANLESTGYPMDRINFVRGKVEETIPESVPERIALLRLDTDWYDSTRHELEQLWPRLQPGGVLIIDDYGHWQGARRAVDEYFDGRSDAPLLNRVDYSGRVGVKPGPPAGRA